MPLLVKVVQGCRRKTEQAIRSRRVSKISPSAPASRFLPTPLQEGVSAISRNKPFPPHVVFGRSAYCINGKQTRAQILKNLLVGRTIFTSPTYAPIPSLSSVASWLIWPGLSGPWLGHLPHLTCYEALGPLLSLPRRWIETQFHVNALNMCCRNRLVWEGAVRFSEGSNSLFFFKQRVWPHTCLKAHTQDLPLALCLR